MPPNRHLIAKPSQANPSRVKPSQAKPSQASSEMRLTETPGLSAKMMLRRDQTHPCRVTQPPDCLVQHALRPGREWQAKRHVVDGGPTGSRPPTWPGQVEDALFVGCQGASIRHRRYCCYSYKSLHQVPISCDRLLFRWESKGQMQDNKIPELAT